MRISRRSYVAHPSIGKEARRNCWIKPLRRKCECMLNIKDELLVLKYILNRRLAQEFWISHRANRCLAVSHLALAYNFLEAPRCYKIQLAARDRDRLLWVNLYNCIYVFSKILQNSSKDFSIPLGGWVLGISRPSNYSNRKCQSTCTVRIICIFLNKISVLVLLLLPHLLLE